MKQYLKEHPLKLGEENFSSIVEYLTECYLEDHPVSDEEILKIQKEMAPYYENVPFVTSERLFNMVYNLCGAYERAAFREGLLMGLHLFDEVSTKK